MAYLFRASIVKPFNKDEVCSSIKKLIESYNSIKSTLSRNEKIEKITNIMIIIMNNPEIIAQFPRVRFVFEEKYNELKNDIDNDVIKSIPKYMEIIMTRNDYVNINNSRYNLRKRDSSINYNESKRMRY